MAVTGAITKKSKSRLIRVYEQMPEPKVVVAIGSCPASGGVYKGSPTLAGPLDEVIPVDYYIPGCPPRPEAIIYGLANAFEALKKK
jgi:membrane-bound hydrogenase subunit mbhJ